MLTLPAAFRAYRTESIAGALFLLCGIHALCSPLHAQSTQASETLYVRITRQSVRVRQDIDMQSAMVGAASAGQRFRLLDYTENAWKIAFLEGDPPVEGWINRDNAVMERSGASLGSVLRGHGRGILTGAGLLIALAVLLMAVCKLMRRAHIKAASRIASDKLVIIVATRAKEIHYTLSNALASMEKCLSEVGFSIQCVGSLEGFDQRIRRRAPDVVLMDWDMGADTADEVEISLGAAPQTASIPIIYYNAPTEVPAQRRPRLRNTYYLGVEFSDRDVLKLIQPHILAAPQATIERGRASQGAISGDISEGGINQVFQLLEIGQKSGCLFVSLEQPYGMVFFEAGNPVFATTRDKKGCDAIYDMLDLTSGTFRFAPGKKAPEKNCSISTMGVLMEWARVKDEATRT